MCKMLRFSFAVVAIVLVAGCPAWTPKTYQFTSADLNGQNRGFLGPAAIDAGGASTEQTPREVVEPDVYRRDGALLYVLNQYRGLTVVNLDTHRVMAQAPTYGYPRDLYIVGSRAYVLVSSAADYARQGDTVTFTVKSRLYVVDISAPDRAHVLSSFDLEGDLVDSRLVGSVLYAVCAQYQWTSNGVVPVVKTQTGASWVTSINVADPANVHQAGQLSFEGMGNVIYATSSALFVAGSDWSSGESTIRYVDISDPNGALVARGSATVRGNIADRFKMDVWNNVLRVVSNAWDNGRRVFLTTINIANPDNLTQIAQSEFERASGDTLFATRFDGPRAYVVTYFVKDPLFVVDLSNPASPAVVGELEVPGWSTHIEPRGNILLALGVDDSNGRRACVSLFDVSRPTFPALVKRVSFGENWSWSNAYNDVKAFSVFDDVLVVPFSGTQGQTSYERMQFVSYTSSSLETRGYIDLNGTGIRSFAYGGAYYALTQEELLAIDATHLDAPAVVYRAGIAENIVDYFELSASVGVTLVFNYGKSTIKARTVAPGGAPLGETEVEIGEFRDAYKYGQTLVLVGAVWTANTSRYRVVLIDCSTPAQPRLQRALDIDVEPYVEYWPVGLGGVVPMPALGIASDIRYMPWYRANYHQNMTFLLNNLLVLRCRTGQFTSVLGGVLPQQGVAVVDLSVPAWVRNIGLAYDNIMSLDAVGQYLYLGSEQPAGNVLSATPLCAYFLTQIDVTIPQAGPNANVPGVFVQYNPSTDVLLLRDQQWDFTGSYRDYLHAVSWDGGVTAQSIADSALPAGTGSALGRGANVYLDGYTGSATALYRVEVSATGALALKDKMPVAQSWAGLLDAKGTSAYATVGGGAITRYDFSSGTGHLADLIEVMGSPSRIRFGSLWAYAPLGYFGIATLPL